METWQSADVPNTQIQTGKGKNFHLCITYVPLYIQAKGIALLDLSLSFVLIWTLTRTVVAPITVYLLCPLSVLFGLLIWSSCSLGIYRTLYTDIHLSQKVLPTQGNSTLTKAHGLGFPLGVSKISKLSSQPSLIYFASTYRVHLAAWVSTIC